MKRAVSVSLGSTSRDHRVVVELLGQEIEIERIGTNGSVRRAKQLYEELDSGVHGPVDCLGVGGAVLSFDTRDRSFTMPAVQRMVAGVQHTPVVDGSGFKNVVERRMAQRLLYEIGEELYPRNVLVSSAADRLGLALSFQEAGFELVLGDLMFALGLPIPLHGLDAFDRILNALGPVLRLLPMSLLYPTGEREDVNKPRFGRWFDWAKVIAGDCNYTTHYMPLDMRGKIVATNTTTPRDIALFRERGVRYLATSTPRMGERSFGTNLMEATLVALSGQGRPLRADEIEALIDELGWGAEILRLN
jgi:hypothetical protein